MLLFNDFAKRYNDRLIIAVPQLTLAPGIYWVRGENGSGKSTLFKSVAGLQPFDGQIEFADNISLKKHPVAFRRRVNFSEAEPLFPGFLTSKDLIHFVGSIKDATAAQKTSLASMLGVDTYLHQPCETYSSGMLKKLSLVLAFLGNPQVTILDEPFITLDDKARAVLLSLINQYNSKGNHITLISSHQAQELSEIPLSATFHIRNQELVRE